MRYRLTLFLVAVFLTVLACKEKIDNRTVSGPQKSGQQTLNPTELPADYRQFRSLVTVAQIAKPTNVSPLTDAELKDEINGDLDYFESVPASSGPCDALIDAIPLKASNKVLSAEATLDAKVCATSAQNEPSVTVSQASLQVLVQFYCEQGDYAKYNGKPMKESEDADCNGGQSYSLTSTIFTVKYNYSSQGTTGTIDLKDYGLFGAPDTTPCASNKIGSTQDYKYGNCVSISRTDSTTTTGSSAAINSTAFSQLKFQDLVATVKAPKGSYYKSGFITFDYNDWLGGKMTYSGATTPPSWTISKGGQNLNGTFAYNANSLALAAQRALHRTTRKIKAPHR